jgi:hypothetical protein
MKKRHGWINLFGIVVLIIIFVGFMTLYLFSTLEKIHSFKREIKDIELKQSDLKNDEDTFYATDKRERSYFVRANRQFRKKFPRVRNRKELDDLHNKVAHHLLEQSQQNHVGNLILSSFYPNYLETKSEYLLKNTTSDRKYRELEILLSSQQNSFFKNQKTKHIKHLLKSNSPHIREILSQVRDLRCSSLVLIFSGRLQDALNFITHIPKENDYLLIDRVLAAPGEDFPNFMVLFHVFFVTRGKISFDSTNNPGKYDSISKADDFSSQEESVITEERGALLIVDHHSELLQEKVYWSDSFQYKTRNLLQRFGKLFISSPGRD